METTNERKHAMTTDRIRRNMSPSMTAKVEAVAKQKKITFDEALVFLLRGVVSPKSKK